MKNLLYVLVAFIAFGCQGQSEKSTDLSPDAFAEKMSGDIQILDVRTSEEFGPQHIKNAQNADIKSADFEKNAAKLDKSKPVLVYCLSGGRSSSAVKKLKAMGFLEVYNLDGGIVKWNAAGKPTVTASHRDSGMSVADFEQLVKSDRKVLIDFYAEWCGPCKKMAPFLAKMKDELKDSVIIVKIDADKNPDLLKSMQIDALPTLLLYEDGKQTWKNIGFITEADLKKQL